MNGLMKEDKKRKLKNKKSQVVKGKYYKALSIIDVFTSLKGIRR